ncbi:Elongation factor Ts, partial [Ananas comosus]
SVSDEISLPEEVKDPSTVTNVVEAAIASSNSLVSEKEESSENETSESTGQDLISETVDKTIEPEVSSSVQDDEEVTEADLKFQTAAKDDESSTSSRADESKELSDSMEEKASYGANDTDNNIESSGETGGENLSPKDVLPEDTAANQEDDNIIDGKEETEKPVVIVNEVKDEKSETSEISEMQNDATDQGSTIKVEAKNTTTISPALVKQLREETGAGMMDCKKALAETDGDIVKAQEYLRKKGLLSADKKASRVTAEGRIGSYVHDGGIGILIEVNCETDFVSRGEIFKQLVDDLAMQVAACPQVRYLATVDVPEEIVSKEKEIEMQKEDLLSKPEQIRAKIVEGRIKKRLEEFALLEQPYIKNDKVVVKDMVKQTIATIGENIKVKRFVRYNLGEGLEKKSQDFAAEVAAQTAAKASPSVPKDNSAEAKPPATAVSAALVKQLREETGAGMMDCKKALTETGGDLVKAQEYLRKKGLSSADKKSSRLAAEGLISAYIHDSRIGCLIEVNCETDFVGQNEKFKELVDDLAMQVVACPQVEFVSIEDISKDIVDKEREIEMQREDIQSKPENIREKIVEGRISKRLGELALLEQPFIKDDGVLVKDLVKQTVAALGENIKVRRFVRFTLGESEE